MPPSRIVDRDKGLKRIRREVVITGAVVEVGIMGPKASAPKQVHEGEKPTPATMVEIAGYQEFGTATIPARSFIGGWFDENEASNKAFARDLALKRLGGKLDYRRSLDLMGVRAQGGIQKRIAAGIAPPLDPATIKRKGSSKPLIDTGQLRSSITYRIASGGT
jgi:hypothetical protein